LQVGTYFHQPIQLRYRPLQKRVLRNPAYRQPIMSLPSIESNIPLDFHRNSLISVKHIEAIERATQGQYQVRLADTEQRPIISRRHVSDVKELLKVM